MALNDGKTKDREIDDCKTYTEDGTVDHHGNIANKSKTGTWKACPFILGFECCERLAYYGMSANLVLYLKNRVGQHGAIAAKNVAEWTGTCYFTPLIGAVLADAYLGRYWTIALFSIIYVMGMTLLALSACVPGLKLGCNEKGDNCHKTMVFVALYLIAIGSGGIKPCVSSFGADQFDSADEVEMGKKVSFFNWFYFSINIGALIASSVIVWTQVNIGWALGFEISATTMAIAVVFFFSGSRFYRQQKLAGRPPNSLDKEAMEERSNDKKCRMNPLRLCTITQEEDLKAILRLLPVWATGIIFATVYGQKSNYYILQGETMDTFLGSSFKIPPASLSIFGTLSVLFWIPIYDRLIVPFAAKFNGNPRGLTQLQRIGIGLFISIFSVFFAGVLELVRLRIVQKHEYYDKEEIIPISVLWQVPQYFIFGCAEVFTFIGQVEFFYEEAPDTRRSVCSAISFLTVAFGQYVSSLLVTIVTKVTARHGRPGWLPDNLNHGKLHYFFWLLSLLSFINFLAYLGVAKLYKYKRPLGIIR